MQAIERQTDLRHADMLAAPGNVLNAKSLVHLETRGRFLDEDTQDAPVFWARCGQTLQPVIDGHHNMTDDRAVPQPRSEPAIATAEEGMVLLDGPDGLAVTMTPAAATATGKNLIDAAAEAELQTQQPKTPG